MKVLSSLFFVLLITFSALAQESTALEGVVSDEVGTVAGATVTLKMAERPRQIYTTTTDKNGKYFFNGVPSGQYLISANIEKADKSGVSAEHSFRLLAERLAVIDLKISSYQPIREEVAVNIASGTSQPVAEISKTVNVLNSGDIRDRNEFSLTETLRTIPGFRVQQLGGFGKTANIKTRGLRNQDTAVLIDGIRFRDASSITGDASAFLSDFVLTDIEKIEVLRGSGSSLYGTNAIGGVLDLRSREPRDGFHGSFLGEGGNLGLKRVLGNVSNGTKKIGFSFGGSRTVYSKGIDGDDDANNTTLNGRIDYKPGGKTHISGRFYFSDAYVRLNSSPDTIGILPSSNSTIINANPITNSQLNGYANGGTITNFGSANFIPDVNDPDNFQESTFFNGQVVLTQIITSKLVFRGHYSGLRSNRRNENGVRGIGFQSASTSDFDGTIQTVNGQFNWTPNATHQATFGYEFEHEKYGNDGSTPSGTGNFFARAYQASNTFYAQDLISLLDNRLQISGGFRAQFFNLKRPSFSSANAPYSGVTLENPPNAYTFDGSAAYYIDKTGTKVRAHVGNGYRVPSLYERFGTFYSSFSQSFIALGDPNLKPERSIAFDGGIDQTILKDRAKLSATYFYTRLIEAVGYGNVVSNIGSTTRPFGGYLNNKGGNSRGAELSGDLRPTTSSNIFASYTFTNSDQRTPQISGSGILKTLGIPSHQFSLVATQRFNGITVNFDFLATSNYLAPIFSNSTFSSYVYRFNGNRKADLTASYSIPLKSEKVNLRVFGTFGNIFSYDYYENGFRTEGRTARGGVGISF